MMSIRGKQVAVGSLARPYVLMIVVWILSMISLPIARWTWGDGVIPLSSLIGVIFQFLAVVMILMHRWDWRRVLTVTLIVGVMTWAAEALGSKTGFPFGSYYYTDLLQPQVFGVPLLIPFAWMMMLAPAWAVAQAIVGPVTTPRRRAAFIAVSALAITAWDLYLDPQMTGWGFWVWQQPGEYFGIPLVNYLGWLLVSGLVTWIVRPAPVPVISLLVVYAIVWILQAIGLAVFWGQPGPAFFGFIAMGLLLGAALMRLRKTAP
jgi:lycopene beta-cyclase